MAENTRKGIPGWIWFLSIVIIGTVIFLFSDGPHRVMNLWTQANQTQTERRESSPPAEMTTQQTEPEVEAEDGDETAAASTVVVPQPRRAEGEERNRRYEATHGRTSTASENAGEVVRSSQGEHHEEGAESFTRYTTRVTGIPRDTCLRRLHFSRMPRTATEGQIAQFTQAFERGICRPENGEDPLPLNGCRGEGNSQVCWDATRKEESATTAAEPTTP